MIIAGVDAYRALQVVDALPCLARAGQGRAGYARNRAGQGKVTKIFTGQVAGYVCRNLSTCDKFCISDIVNIFSKVIHKEKNRSKLITKLKCLPRYLTEIEGFPWTYKSRKFHDFRELYIKNTKKEAI